MASTTTNNDHIVVLVGVRVSVPTTTSAQHQAPTAAAPTVVVLSEPQDASVDTHVHVDDQAVPPPPQPTREIVSEPESEFEPQPAEAEPQPQPPQQPQPEQPQPEQPEQPQPQPQPQPASANVDCLRRSHWLRAVVLGAIIGLLAPASVILDTSYPAISNAPFAKPNLPFYLSIVTGAVTMAMGEYISISSQLDMHGRDERGSPNPWAAALFSSLGFLIGSMIVMLPFAYLRSLAYPLKVATFGGIVSLGLVALGCVAAMLGQIRVSTFIKRHVVGGLLVVVVTVGFAVALVSLNAYDNDD